MVEARRDTCEEMRELLALAAGQDLGDAQSRQVWNHLAGCMSCRREYSSYLKLRSVLAELEPGRGASNPELGSGFFDSLEQGILDKVAVPVGVRANRRLWATAAAAVLVLLGVWFAVPQQPGLLDRPALESFPGRVVDPDALRVPLSFDTTYPQGLGAQQQVDELFGPEHEDRGFVRVSFIKGR